MIFAPPSKATRTCFFFFLLLCVLPVRSGALTNGVSALRLSLAGAVDMGLKNNYDLKYNRIDQYIQSRIIRENWRLFFPTFAVDYGNSYNVIPYGEDSRLHTLKFRLSQPLYQGGRYYAYYKMSRLDARIKQRVHDILYNDIITSVHKQYFSALIQEEIVHIQERLVEQSRIQAEFSRKENQLGMLTTIDLAEIEAYAKTSELDLIKARHGLLEEHNKLKRLLYMDWQTDLVVDRSVISNISYFPFNKNLEELVYTAHEKRRDLLNMDLEKMKSRYNYNMNKYYYLPAVSLNLEYDLSGEKFYPFERSWNIGLQFDFLFKGTTLSSSGTYGKDLASDGKTLASSSSLSPFADIGYQRRYIQAEADLKTTAVQQEQLKQDIAAEVQKYHSQVQQGWELLDILKSREDVLRKRSEIYHLKVRLGEAKRVDMMEAELEYYNARVESVKGILSYITSSLDLETAIGADPGSLGTVKYK